VHSRGPSVPSGVRAGARAQRRTPARRVVALVLSARRTVLAPQPHVPARRAPAGAGGPPDRPATRSAGPPRLPRGRDQAGGRVTPKRQGDGGALGAVPSFLPRRPLARLGRRAHLADAGHGASGRAVRPPPRFGRTLRTDRALRGPNKRERPPQSVPLWQTDFGGWERSRHALSPTVEGSRGCLPEGGSGGEARAGGARSAGSGGE